MSTAYKILSLDESGKASYKHASELFILSGVIIPERFKLRLDNKIRKLKTKFFKDEEIIFHSRDMFRKAGVFSLFKDPDIEMRFWSEFVSIINNQEINLLFVITEKNKASKKGWQPKTILRKSYLTALQKFFELLKKTSSKGKIIVESDPSQDLFLIEAHNTLQNKECEYRKYITSLSLVNKANMDADVQIADALASIVGKLYTKKKLDKIGSMKKRLIERKLFGRQSLSTLEKLP